MLLFLVITFKEFTFQYMLKRDVKIPSSWSFIILSLCFWSVFLSGWDSGKLASWFYIATISGTGSIWAPPGGVLQGFYGSSLKWKVLKSQSGRSKGQKLDRPFLVELSFNLSFERPLLCKLPFSWAQDRPLLNMSSPDIWNGLKLNLYKRCGSSSFKDLSLYPERSENRIKKTIMWSRQNYRFRELYYFMGPIPIRLFPKENLV